MFIEPANLKVSIVRWVADEPQPGVVAAHFGDSCGQDHVFIDKQPIFTIGNLGPGAIYPVAGLIRCVIVRILDDTTVIIDTSVPDGVESVDGATRFAVHREQLEADIAPPVASRNFGTPYFTDRDYREVRSWLATVFTGHQGRYLLDILDSMIEQGADRYVALTTSMHDLIFALRPAIPPVGIIAVRAPGSLRPSRLDGHVRVDHIDNLWHITTIERPEAEALPLFWRFMRTEFGITPERSLD